MHRNATYVKSQPAEETQLCTTMPTRWLSTANGKLLISRIKMEEFGEAPVKSEPMESETVFETQKYKFTSMVSENVCQSSIAVIKGRTKDKFCVKSEPSISDTDGGVEELSRGFIPSCSTRLSIKTEPTDMSKACENETQSPYSLQQGSPLSSLWPHSRDNCWSTEQRDPGWTTGQLDGCRSTEQHNGWTNEQHNNRTPEHNNGCVSEQRNSQTTEPNGWTDEQRNSRTTEHDNGSTIWTNKQRNSRTNGHNDWTNKQHTSLTTEHDNGGANEQNCNSWTAEEDEQPERKHRRPSPRAGFHPDDLNVMMSAYTYVDKSGKSVGVPKQEMVINKFEDDMNGIYRENTHSFGDDQRGLKREADAIQPRDVTNDETAVDDHQRHLSKKQCVESPPGADNSMCVSENKLLISKRFKKKTSASRHGGNSKSGEISRTNGPVRSKKVNKVRGTKRIVRENSVNSRAYVCTKCGRSYITAKLLRKHLVLHDGRTSCRCSVCNQIFPTVSSLANHMKTHGSSTKRVCKENNKRGFSIGKSKNANIIGREKDDLNDSAEKARFESGKACHKCERYFPDLSELEKHMERNQCTATKKDARNYTPKDATRMDFIEHAGEKHFRCKPCNRVFVRLSIDAHLKSADHLSTMENKPTNCSMCGKSFPKMHLQEHLMTHGGENLDTCLVCQRSYIGQPPLYLIYHVRTHTGYRPFACEKCDSRFYNGSSYRQHIQRCGVQVERHFKCSPCDKTFLRNWDLQKHLKSRIHKDVVEDKPAKCYLCGKLFPKFTQMQEHQKTHSVLCPICGRSFNDKWNMAAHYKDHAGGNAYACHICGKIIKTKSCMKYHMRKHTSVK